MSTYVKLYVKPEELTLLSLGKEGGTAIASTHAATEWDVEVIVPLNAVTIPVGGAGIAYVDINKLQGE